MKIFKKNSKKTRKGLSKKQAKQLRGVVGFTGLVAGATMVAMGTTAAVNKIGKLTKRVSNKAEQVKDQLVAKRHEAEEVEV